MKPFALMFTLAVAVAAPCAVAGDKDPPATKTAKVGKPRQAPARTGDDRSATPADAPGSRGAPDRPGGRQGTPGPGSRRGQAGAIVIDSFDAQVEERGAPAQGSGGGVEVRDFQATVDTGKGGDQGRGGVRVDEIDVQVEEAEPQGGVVFDEVKVVVEPGKGGSDDSDDGSGGDVDGDKGGSSYGGDQEEGGNRRRVTPATDGRPDIGGRAFDQAVGPRGGGADPSDPAATPTEDGQAGNGGKTKGDGKHTGKHQTGKGQVRTSNPVRRGGN
ncbi:hypothetical protein ABAC460_01610 [Asticcacaulis sp. AC460]|uniref:hypothetical protein n=1 Tax=Asticcacaulis sp. AC460 TaxID=1282360 RepID=UPI0003C4008B|nr:hypothetical protein [Asticcacaulis sp. AC460]ESQ92973.1 hypothetical protein ABAC460_01610 [Asticcacaulis sp. AC460]